MENQNTIAQENLENGQNKAQNFFFNHVKEVIKQKKENNTLLSELEKIESITAQKYAVDLKRDEFELIGIFAFLTGIDYTSQHYIQEKVLKNVQKRFEEVEINKEELEVFRNIIANLASKDYYKEFFTNTIEKMKTSITNEIEVAEEDKLNFKNLKAQINKFIDCVVIPISLSISVVEIKKENLTYERMLKINSLLNEQSTIFGKNIQKIIDLYSNPLFSNLLKKSSEVFNDAKFALLYEESITSVIETMNRIGLVIADEFTEEDYKRFEEDYKAELKKIQEKEEQEEQVEQNEEDVEKFEHQFTEKEVKELMENNPDEFIFTALQDTIKKYIHTKEEMCEAIEELIKHNDYVQHIYTYIGKNMKNENRVVGKTGLPETIVVEELTTALNDIIVKYGEEYKKLAEINCAEIPEEQQNRIVTYVNDCIKSCLLKTNDQKQYLVSQIIENGITTWNHLQQILSIIETCKIKGEDAVNYVTLYNYTQDKSNIVDVFENATKLTQIEVKMSVFRSMREWYKFHLPSKSEK